jgi:DNA polymerase (family X)
MATITNRDAANLLFNVATILEMAEDNPYRIRAYRRAARLLLALPLDARIPLAEGRKGRELDLPGLGDRLRRKLGELLTTGRMRFYVDLCAELPDEIAALMQVPEIGPKTARRLHEELGISTPRGIVEAAEAGRIRELYGFGERRERSLREGALAVMGGNVRSFVPRPETTEADLPDLVSGDDFVEAA